MKNLILVIVVLFCFTLTSFGQILDPVLGPRVYKKDNVKQRKAIELTHLREADAMWSTRIWREIDLRQKLNHPLFYPLDSIYHGKRSLIQVIVDEYVNNPKNVGPNAIKFYADDQLSIEVTQESIRKFMIKADTVDIVDDVTCAVTKKWIENDFINKVKPYMTKFFLMEDWFFDKQRSVMDVRILAIGFKVPFVDLISNPTPNCGIISFEKFGDPDIANGQTYWMFFPQLRPMLASLETYNRDNDAMRLSYDDIFLQRIFSSFIYKQENVYNRKISDYTAGLEALLEAEKIKQEIFDFEQNLWEY